MLGGSTVTIDMRAPAGTYAVPVTASDGDLDVTYTYTIIINPTPGANTAPTVTPSTPGPYIAGTGGSFDVSADFSDSDGNTLMYALGTVSGPVAGAVRLRDSTVTVGTTATAGRYSIPVVATDNGMPPLSVSHTYQVVVNAPALPSVSISAVNASVTEGMPATFTVTATTAPSSDLTVNVSVTDSGNFISGMAPTTVMIPATMTTATLTVATDDDSTDEVNGTLTATVETGADYTVGSPASASVAVNDNDAPAPPAVSITAVNTSVTEGMPATFTVTATTAPPSALTVNVSVTDSDSFISGMAPTTVTIPATMTTATLTVATEDDSTDEANGTLTATVETGADYTVGAPPSAMVTVNDNDVAGITVSPTTGLRTTEAGGTAMFTVVLDSQPTASVSIGVSSSDTGEGTVSPTTLTFTNSDWDQTQPVTVAGVDDALADGDQAYMVLLAAATSTDLNYNGLDPDNVSVTNEDDLTVTITAGTSPVDEGTDATFTVTASAMPSSALTVNVSVTDSGSFISGSAPTTVTINPGSTSATLTVTTDDDSTDEVGGTITAMVATGTGYDVGTAASASVSVNDNDGAAEPTVTISAGGGVTEGTSATFTVTASVMPSSNLTVNVSVTDNGSFISGVAPTTVTINPGSTSATLTVATDDDSTDEVNGTITAEVTTGSGYAVGTPSRAMVTGDG